MWAPPDFDFEGIWLTTGDSFTWSPPDEGTFLVFEDFVEFLAWPATLSDPFKFPLPLRSVRKTTTLLLDSFRLEECWVVPGFVDCITAELFEI